MNEYVIDTNVWVMIDKHPDEVDTLMELDCIQCCGDWLKEFIGHLDCRLILDNMHMILREYRGKIRRGGLGERYLNDLEAQPRNRLVELEIACDDEGCAKVPDLLCDFDRSDWKFVAVALAHNPIPTIVNATDTDWCKAENELKQCGITVHECCPSCVQEALARKTKGRGQSTTSKHDLE